MIKRPLVVSIYIVVFLMLHVRHGMHLTTGLSQIDNWVMNPTQRPNFAIKSKAMEFAKMEIEKANRPTRVIGEGDILFAGFNSRFRTEGITPVEPLRNKHFTKLLNALDYPVTRMGWVWTITHDQIESRAVTLDLLGIGYVLAQVGTPMPRGMKLVHSSDLAVWRRDSAWPRAFFVNNFIELEDPADIKALADKSHMPFAAVENQFVPQRTLINDNIPYQVIPAQEYRLTNNSTRFSVEASGPGLIVLGESYYPGDFIATVNGAKVDYIRVNEAFKGIWVNKAGKYDVSFTYRPEKLNLAISIALCGLGALLIGALYGRVRIGQPGRHECQ